MTNTILILESLEKTRLLGEIIGRTARAGEILCLDGDLGAGKTTLTQSIARGLDVPSKYYITSPSFNVFHEYPGRLPLYHMDFYRLNDSDDVMAIGLEEYFFKAGFAVIEWAEKASDILPKSCLYFTFKVKEHNCRELTISYYDDYWLQRVKSIMAKINENS